MTTSIANRKTSLEPVTLASECELSVVLPCLNEADTVGRCVTMALETLHRMHIDGEVVVVDNGSDDASAEVARRAGARASSRKRAAATATRCAAESRRRAAASL